MCTTAQAQDAQAIVQKFEQQKIEALNAYLTAQPEAKDRSVALEAMIQAYVQTEQMDRTAPLFKQLYQALPKDDVERAINGAVLPYLQHLSQQNDLDEAKSFIAQVKKDFANSPHAESLHQFFEQRLADFGSPPGKGESLEIEVKDLDGNEISLSRLTAQGKVVLVDFWATWCQPCRLEMPHVKAAYDAYRDKGFEVIGISLDKNEATLRNVLKKDRIAWPQSCDGKAWEGDLVTRYKIKSIPATFLIGKDGKIVETNLQGDELKTRVGKLLDAPGKTE